MTHVSGVDDVASSAHVQKNDVFRRWPTREASGCVARFDVQALSERGKGRLDLVKPGMMPKRKKTFDVCFWYPDAARKFRLLQARFQERNVEIDLGSLKRRSRHRPEFPAAMELGGGQRPGFPDVATDSEHQQLLRHLHGLLFGFALRYAVAEIRKGHDVAARLPVRWW